MITGNIDLQASQAARAFNATYDTQLKLVHNDCWSHTKALARHLLGHDDICWEQ